MAIDPMTAELASMISTWLEGHPSRNRRGLSRAVGNDVSYSTISRILQGETTAELEVVLNILPIIADKETGLDFLNRHRPKYACYFKDLSGSDDKVSSRIDDAYKDLDSFVIMALALGGGTSREEVERLCGTLSLDKVEELLNNSLLREINGRLLAKEDSYMILSPETALNMARHMLSLWNKTRVGEDGCICLVKTDNVSEKDMRRIHEVLKEAHARCSSIARQSEGPRTYFSSIVMNTLR